MFTMMLFVLASVAFMSMFKYVLSSLICLEYMALMVFVMITSSPIFIPLEMYNAFFYIAIAVCEAALGLGLVVLYIRKKGNDLMKPF